MLRSFMLCYLSSIIYWSQYLLQMLTTWHSLRRPLMKIPGVTRYRRGRREREKQHVEIDAAKRPVKSGCRRIKRRPRGSENRRPDTRSLNKTYQRLIYHRSKAPVTHTFRSNFPPFSSPLRVREFHLATIARS